MQLPPSEANASNFNPLLSLRHLHSTTLLHRLLPVELDNLFLIMSNFYGYKSDSLNKKIMEDLTNGISELKTGIRNWNITLHEWEHR